MHSDNELPSMTVVIPCCNAERWIAQAIQSVLDQNYKDLEIIVIDDGSTDNSLEVIKSFGDRIFWQTGPNFGACVARNKGLAAANSDYILFLDADDWMEGNLLHAMAEATLCENLDVIFAVSRTERQGKIEAHSRMPPSLDEKGLLESFLAGQVTQTGAMLWRTDFLGAIGGWNILVVRCQEIELVLRALVGGRARARAISSGFVNWRQHDDPARISFRVEEASFQSRSAFHDALTANIGNSDDSVRYAFGKDYYMLACAAYYNKAYFWGDHALAQARRLGFTGHEGPTTERLIASVLGLRNLQHLQKGRRALGRSRLGPVLRKLRDVKRSIVTRSASQLSSIKR